MNVGSIAQIVWFSELDEKISCLVKRGKSILLYLIYNLTNGREQKFLALTIFKGIVHSKN